VSGKGWVIDHKSENYQRKISTFGDVSVVTVTREFAEKSRN